MVTGGAAGVVDGRLKEKALFSDGLFSVGLFSVVLVVLDGAVKLKEKEGFGGSLVVVVVGAWVDGAVGWAVVFPKSEGKEVGGAGCD